MCPLNTTDYHIQLSTSYCSRSIFTPPCVKWFGLTAQISFIKFQLTIKGGPHYICTLTFYDPGKWDIYSVRVGFFLNFQIRKNNLAYHFYAVIFFPKGENMDPHSSSDFESYSSSCSTASPGGDTPRCSDQRPPDRLLSPVDSSIIEVHAARQVLPTRNLTEKRVYNVIVKSRHLSFYDTL